MEANCGFLPWAHERHFAGPVLHEIEGKGCYLDGRYGTVAPPLFFFFTDYGFVEQNTNGDRYTGWRVQWTSTKRTAGASSQARLEMGLHRQHVEKKDWNWDANTRNSNKRIIRSSTRKRRKQKMRSKVDKRMGHGTMDLWSIEVCA